jgi:hypothetical protein
MNKKQFERKFEKAKINTEGIVVICLNGNNLIFATKYEYSIYLERSVYFYNKRNLSGFVSLRSKKRVR